MKALEMQNQEGPIRPHKKVCGIVLRGKGKMSGPNLSLKSAAHSEACVTDNLELFKNIPLAL